MTKEPLSALHAELERQDQDLVELEDALRALTAQGHEIELPPTFLAELDDACEVRVMNAAGIASYPVGIRG